MLCHEYGPVTGCLAIKWTLVATLQNQPTTTSGLRTSEFGTKTCVPPPPPRARHEWRRAQKILLQRTTSKSHIGEVAPMALCDIHIAGCGEHLPARGLRDDRILGTDQAVRGGRHGQKLHSGFPPKAGGCPQ